MASTMSWAESALGSRLDSEALLADALTHRSHGSRNNERLEFLGDALAADLHQHPAHPVEQLLEL